MTAPTSGLLTSGERDLFDLGGLSASAGCFWLNWTVGVGADVYLGTAATYEAWVAIGPLALRFSFRPRGGAQ